MYYHGTTLEKALRILKDGKIKGHKKFEEHRKSYVSISENISTSRQFGQVVFALEEIQKEIIEVEYENKQWIDNNVEVIEYVYERKMDKENLNYEFIALNGEKEYLIEEELLFSELRISEIVIFAPTEEEADEMYDAITPLLPYDVAMTFLQEPAFDPVNYWMMVDYIQGKGE